MDPKRPTKADYEAPPELDQLRAMRERALETLDEQRRRAGELEQRVAADIDRLANELAEEFASQGRQAADEAGAALRAEREELEQQRADYESERGEWEQLRDGVEQELQQLQQRLGEEAAEQQTRQAELGRREQTLADEKKRLAEWAAQLADERTEIETLRSELRDAEESLAEQRPADPEAEARRDAELAEWRSKHEELTAANEELIATLTAAREELSRRDESAGAAAVETEQKFQLALADVQSHRQRVAELEQQLATRPESGADESAELAQLRAECDGLRARVAELESLPPDTGPPSEEIEELRRRFELAVEDVRELKTEKAELERRLAEAGSAAPTTGALDWEAQKRQLIASLEGGEAPPPASEERATIEGTIRITDEVIAEKDREIARLQEQVAGEALAAPPPIELDDDQRLEAERQRLEQLEQQWEEKLRAAELELSVERAKMAREQAELADLRVELEAQNRRLRSSSSPSRGAPADADAGGAQSNWLKKLGLRGKE